MKVLVCGCNQEKALEGRLRYCEIFANLWLKLYFYSFGRDIMRGGGVCWHFSVFPLHYSEPSVPLILAALWRHDNPHTKTVAPHSCETWLLAQCRKNCIGAIKKNILLMVHRGQRWQERHETHGRREERPDGPPPERGDPLRAVQRGGVQARVLR